MRPIRRAAVVVTGLLTLTACASTASFDNPGFDGGRARAGCPVFSVRTPRKRARF